MATRYVNQKKGIGVPRGAPAPTAFTNPSLPAKRLTDALRAADPGDTVVVQDKATYSEGEIVIDKPITLVSSAALITFPPKPTQSSYKPGSFPRITPLRKGSSRVLRVQFGKDTSPGHVLIRGFEIADGKAINRPGEPAWGTGGGITVVDVNDVLIQDCFITGNQTEGVPFGIISTIPFKDTVVKRMVEVLGLIPILGALTVMLAGKGVRAELDARMPDSRPNNLLAGQCFGGGICFAWSSGRIESCRIENNHANGRGSGIGVIGYGWPTISDCLISKNTSGNQQWARRDGGGIGVEIALPEKFGRDLAESDLLKALTDWLATTPTTSLAGMIAGAAAGAIIAAIKNGEWSKLAELVLYRFARAYLQSQKWSAWVQADIQAAQKRNVFVTKCIIEGNEAFDDGGGVYCSVLSRIKIEASYVQKNKAVTGSGGGIRTSMGSDLTLGQSKVAENLSGGTKLGGGGIACRNTAVEVVGTNDAPTIIRDNKCLNWAGGGAFLEAVSEGALAGIHDMWQAIMLEVFNFTSMKVNFDALSSVISNSAGTPRAASPHGKGGGLYIIRGAIDDVAELHIEIFEFARNVTRNVAYSKLLIGTPAGIKLKVTKVTDQVNLVDLKKGVDDGDSDIPKHLGRSLRHPFAKVTTFLYDSI